MKKSVLVILALVMVFTAIVPASAEDVQKERVLADGTVIINCDDGGYIIIYPAVAVSSTRSSTTKSKTEKKFDSSGNTVWTYTLYGTFTYTYGVSATCTAASYSKNIFDSSWSFSNGSAMASGAKARGVGTFTKSWLFVTTDTVNVDLTLTCDKYGNVS